MNNGIPFYLFTRNTIFAVTALASSVIIGLFIISYKTLRKNKQQEEE